MNEILKNLPAYTGIALGAYTALLFGAQAFELVSEKITSQEQLDDVVEEESNKLGMDSRLVVGRFYAVSGKDYDRIRGVRHELYHLHKHMPLRKNPIAKFLRGFFYEEPTATLYATTGIRL